MEQAEDGDLSSWTDEFIAESAGFQGDAPRFVSLLQMHGWLDGKKLHDWLDYAGRFLRGKYSSREREKLVAIWSKHGKTYGADTMPTQCRQVADKLPTPTLPDLTKPKDKDGPPPAKKPTKNALVGSREEAFLRFWCEYPRKRAKGDAEKAWKSINPGDELIARILASLVRAKTSRDWLVEGGRFVPYPATWLRGKRWEDDVGVPSAETKPQEEVNTAILEIQGLSPKGGSS